MLYNINYLKNELGALKMQIYYDKNERILHTNLVICGIIYMFSLVTIRKEAK